MVFQAANLQSNCLKASRSDRHRTVYLTTSVDPPQVMLHHTAVARWDTGKLLRIIRSISVGVNYLHTAQPAVLHRDLKPGNIFVDTGQVGDAPLPIQCKRSIL